ncbi:BnaA09g05750D [Brassica napus]|uniref:BnaA09g05750D protein n=1 Tax=Brassica napus TaxID=3708 RepID=A0A078FVJ4_BRANA|nr:BnaA09g05750D [Brassica napus]
MTIVFYSLVKIMVCINDTYLCIFVTIKTCSSYAACSDSGRIVVVEYNKEKNVLDRVHQETFGKSGDVACLDIAPVPEGRQRSPFLAVGSYDIIITVRILSLDPDDRLQILMFERNHGSSEIRWGMVGTMRRIRKTRSVMSSMAIPKPSQRSGSLASEFLTLRRKQLIQLVYWNFQDIEAAYSVCTVNFHDKENDARNKII